MQLIGDSDTTAFNELYDRYSRKLLFYFYRMLGGSQQKAQDFVQDLFLKIIEKPERFDTRKNFSIWLFSVAYNQCKNEYRRISVRNDHAQKLLYSNEYSDTDSAKQMDEKIDRRKLQEALNRELRKYDPPSRHVFLLRFQENMSIKQISEITGRKEGTVKSKLFYMIKKLSENLKQYHPLLEEDGQ